MCCSGLTLACSDYPRDSAGTLDRAQDGSFTVGWSGQAQADPWVQRFVQAVAARIGSRPVSVAGDTEPLLSRLEKGEIDLIVGTFEHKSPWEGRVTFSRPVFIADNGALEGKAASHSGEHAWAIEIDRAIKDGAPRALEQNCIAEDAAALEAALTERFPASADQDAGNGPLHPCDGGRRGQIRARKTR